MELHIYYRYGGWYSAIHHIKNDLEAEMYVEHTALRDNRISTWKLIGGAAFNERAIWVRESPDDPMPKLIRAAKDYTGRWHNPPSRSQDESVDGETLSFAA